MDNISNKYLLKDNIILSFEPLTPEDFIDYNYKPEGDNQLRKNILFLNEENEPVFEFKSAREMARYFKIDAKLARTAIEKGVYLNFTLVNKLVSFRKTVFVFDSNNLNLITELKSLTIAMNYAKVNFYTLKKLLETNKAHNGKIYSYNKSLKFNK
jgi:6-pyruvoyl-tetrahydropterin synthase